MVPGIDVKVLGLDEKPEIVQCVTNVLNSSGGMAMAPEEADHRGIIETASAQGCGVMYSSGGGWIVTDQIDRAVKAHSPEQRDFERAAAFRELAQELGVSAAQLAHQYALSMSSVDTVVLGKSPSELEQALTAEATTLSAELVERMNALYQ